jgi:hypothetical protein
VLNGVVSSDQVGGRGVDGLRQPQRGAGAGADACWRSWRDIVNPAMHVDAVASGAMWSLRGTVLNCTVARRSVLVVLLI